MSLLLLFDNRPQGLSPQLAASLGLRTWRSVQDGRQAAITERTEAEARDLLRGYDGTVIFGAEGVWRQLPELRSLFAVEVERSTLTGPKRRFLPRAKLIPDDQLTGFVRFEPAMSILEMRAPGFLDFRAPIEEVTFECEALSRHEPGPETDLTGKFVFFCEDLAFSRSTIGGLTYLTPREMIERTNLVALINTFDADFDFGETARWPFGPLPEWTSGVLIADCEDDAHGAFALARISRLLAAVALTTSVSGRITVQLQLSHGQGSYVPRHRETWHMPFAQPIVMAPATVVESDEMFWRTNQVCSVQDFKRFQSAKEDYRALSLETAADARSAVPPLQFVQIWMAVERLLSFRHETTMQLAMALPALFPAPERPVIFKKLKGLYGLRSDIAHGYAFERSGEIQEDIRWMNDLYRRLFLLSLDFSRDKELQQAMLNHVLAGEAGTMPLEKGVDAQGPTSRSSN